MAVGMTCHDMWNLCASPRTKSGSKRQLWGSSPCGLAPGASVLDHSAKLSWAVRPPCAHLAKPTGPIALQNPQTGTTEEIATNDKIVVSKSWKHEPKKQPARSPNLSQTKQFAMVAEMAAWEHCSRYLWSFGWTSLADVSFADPPKLAPNSSHCVHEQRFGSRKACVAKGERVATNVDIVSRQIHTSK